MKLKLIFLMVFVLISLSISSVCAGDTDNTTIPVIDEFSSTNYVIGQLESDSSNGTGTFDDLQVEINNAPGGSVLNLTRDYNTNITAKVNHQVLVQGSDNTSNFAELQKMIDDAPENSIINLEKNYKYNSGFSNLGISIDKKLTINGNGYTIDASNASRIFYTTSTLTLINITLKNGNMADMIYNKGGAVYATDSVYIINSAFMDNTGGYSGGAICSTKDVIVKNSIFVNNCVDAFFGAFQCKGGAIRSGGDVKIDNCSFLNNHAADYGGAIYADTITWVNTTSYFIGNYVDDNCGGAIYTNKFKTDIYYGVFINNQAKANDDGGAIYINNENHLTIAQCYFENNRCGDEGGAIYTDSMDSHLKLLNNIFIDNDAGDKGDIVYNSGYYDAIAFNWFGTNNPSFDNKFKEYHMWGSDEDHSDGYPVHAKLLLDDNCEVGKEYNLTVYFEDGKGNPAILPCDFIDISIGADNNAKISDWHEVSECTYVTGITFANTGVTHITGQVNNQVLELDVLATVNDFQHRHENASNSANVVTNNDYNVDNNDYNVDNNGNTNLFSVISNVENADHTNSSNKTPK